MCKSEQAVQQALELGEKILIREKEMIREKVDNIEEDNRKYDSSILNLLLKDKTTGKNIMWCTTTYIENGMGYNVYDEINSTSIVGIHNNRIKQRTAKIRSVQEERTRTNAEVFTPSWVCNTQNNTIDAEWFGYENVFNKESGCGWEATIEKIKFPSKKKNWKRYVDTKRLEIACGEAPYLISRYDTVTGRVIPLSQRIGLFDRKMRVINENVKDDTEWINWSIRAVQSIFGYEYQGDNLFIARENFFLSYLDYYQERFNSEPKKLLKKKIANIIAWNLWQMDGLKLVIPNSCYEIKGEKQLEMNEWLKNISSKEEEAKDDCWGCKYGDIARHNGYYCKIKDWRSNKSVVFADLMKGKIGNE